MEEQRLRRAIFEGNSPNVQQILQQPGFNSGWMALHIAAISGHVAILQAILQLEAVNVNLRSVGGNAPLHACSVSDSNALHVACASSQTNFMLSPFSPLK